MPIYEYECPNCGKVIELLRHIADRDRMPKCECKVEMRRKVAKPCPPVVPMTNKDAVMKRLNQEDGYDVPGGPQDRKRYEQVIAKGLDQSRPIVVQGIG